MSTFKHSVQYMSNLTPYQRQELTLRANQSRSETSEEFILPLNHHDKHFLKWCFMVRYPWAAEPVRGVHYDVIPSRLIKEVYRFYPGIDVTKNASDVVVLTDSGVAGSTWSYFAACRWGPPTACLNDYPIVGTPSTFGTDWSCIPWMSSATPLNGTATRNLSNTMAFGPPTGTEGTSDVYATRMPVDGHYWDGTTAKQWTGGCGGFLKEFYEIAPYYSSSAGCPQMIRPLACGQQITFLSSAEKRKGVITFIETDGNTGIPGGLGTSVTQSISGYSQGTSGVGGNQLRGVRRYNLIGSASGFHQIYHPQTMVDHSWLAWKSTSTPTTSNSQSWTNNGMTYYDGAKPQFRSTSMFWIASGLDPTEQVTVDMTYIYELVDGIDQCDEFDIGIQHNSAVSSAAKGAMQYASTSAHHTGTSGAGIASTSEVAASGIL